MKVVLTAEALGDLEEIGDYIARDSPVRARTFVAELLVAARKIGEIPKGFPLVPRFEGRPRPTPRPRLLSEASRVFRRRFHLSHATISRLSVAA